jgi:ribosomal protein L9
MSDYKPCPIGGLICTKCCYPVQPTEKGIQNHEITSVKCVVSKHETGSRTTSVDRKRIIDDYNVFMKDLATKVADDVNKMKNFISGRRLYWYCTKCEIMIFDKNIHKSGKHGKFCEAKRYGYASLYWSKKEPVILDDNFTIDDDNSIGINENFHNEILKCKQQQQSDQQQLQQQNNILTFHQQMHEQEMLFREVEQTVILDSTDQTKSPNLWVQRCGWDEYLKTYDAISIYEMTQKTDVTAIYEKQLETSILHSISYIKTTFPLSHHIYFEIHRRADEKVKFPTRPYRIKPEKTNRRYIGYYKIILRIIIKIDNYYNESRDSDTVPEYPRIYMSDNTCRVIASNTSTEGK